MDAALDEEGEGEGEGEGDGSGDGDGGRVGAGAGAVIMKGLYTMISVWSFVFSTVFSV